MSLFHFPGKQKSTCMEAWQDAHRLVWPGFQVPKLLEPLSKRNVARESGFFPEQTVPTSLMFAIFVFQITNPKRNTTFRSLSASAFIDFVAACCSTGELVLKVSTAGGNGQPWELPVPRNGQLPLNCFLTDELQQKFEEEWQWMMQDHV